MAYQRVIEPWEPITTPPCAYLRSKAIFVTGSLDRPNHADEEGSDYCWCNLTQHIIGPDDDDVSRRRCVPGRGCFRSS